MLQLPACSTKEDRPSQFHDGSSGVGKDLGWDMVSLLEITHRAVTSFVLGLPDNRDYHALSKASSQKPSIK